MTFLTLMTFLSGSESSQMMPSEYRGSWKMEPEFFFFNLDCVSACAHVPAAWIQLFIEASRGCWKLWNYRWRWLFIVPNACWDPDIGPLEEQQMLLSTESSL